MCIYTHKYIAMRINTCYNNGAKGVVDVPMTARQMIKLLEKNGFEEIRQVGSHKQFFNKKTGKKTTVPFHSGDLPIGTERSILTQAGIKK